MSSDMELLRDQVQRLNFSRGLLQDTLPSPSTLSQVDEAWDSQPMAPMLSDQSVMAPLIAEYDHHLATMTEQLRQYQRQMANIKVKLETVVKENERLHSEQRESVEKQLQSFTMATGDILGDPVTLVNLEEQVQCSVQEKERALDLWQAAAQELERLQQLYQSSVSEGQVHAAESQRTQNQLAHVQQHTQNLQVANQKLESTNQQFLKTVTEQSTELEELSSQLRQAKLDSRTATAKVDEMTRLMQSVQGQMQRREDDAVQAHGREEASDRRLLQLQTALGQLEGRLKVATQDSEQVRREQAVWERQVGELQGRCATVEEEKYEAFAKVRDAIQLAEEASLHKDQAQLREKQKIEEQEKMKEAMRQLIQDAAVRTRKEVEHVRKQCNVQIHRMAEELAALQLECADKVSQIERAHRERKAVEDELEKVYREGRSGEPEFRKMEALHQRCLNAERLKDDMQITLQSTHTRVKKMEMDYSEELSRGQEEVRRLQEALAGARDDCGSVSEERLQLQQESQQLRRDMEEQRKASMLTQRRAKQQVYHLEQEFSVKQQGLDAQLRELENSGRNSSADLTRLLHAQQKTTKRWKEEARKLAEAFEKKLRSLKAELIRQRQRSQELEFQLEADHEKIVEYERQMAEYQEKSIRLQRRLTQAEQRASSASQQLSIMGHVRKAASMVDLETL